VFALKISAPLSIVTALGSDEFRAAQKAKQARFMIGAFNVPETLAEWGL
jgi:hypothetical protein